MAALAGSSKGAQINWEKDVNPPPATALAAYAEAGADVLYILTGRRTVDRPDNAVTQIEDQLAGIRRDLLEPTRYISPGQTAEEAEQATLARSASSLRAMLRYDTDFLSPEMREEVESLLDIAEDPLKWAMYRAADRMQMRKKREEMKRRLFGWFDGSPYEPGDAVMNILTTLAIDYVVPDEFIAELVELFHTDIVGLSGHK
ncbi:hypothetical protein [Sphingomonas oryzagri]